MNTVKASSEDLVLTDCWINIFISDCFKSFLHLQLSKCVFMFFSVNVLKMCITVLLYFKN